MRVGRKPLLVPRRAGARTTIDRDVTEFSETMGYDGTEFASREKFLAAFSAPWILELNEVLRELLQRDRRILSIGSGFGEHEVRLALEGYPVTASDVVTQTLERTARLFSELPVAVVDAFDLPRAGYDDVLITGIDFYFDDAKARDLLAGIATALPPAGRCIFTLRYNDNVATKGIDRIGIPLLVLVSNALRRVRGRGDRYVLKDHGYRRSRRDIERLAIAAGFTVKRVRYAGFGMELLRLQVDRISPRVFELLVRTDRRLHLLQNCTVLELVREGDA